MMRILHFVSTPATWSGVMSVIMNYYRHIDRMQLQFDFLCFQRSEENYEDEIQKLGGKVYYVRKPESSLQSICDLRDFFMQHTGEYSCLHNHEVYLSFILEPVSKKYGISQFVIHSHATQYSDKRLNAIRNRILCSPIKYMNCKKLACSRAASEFLYGDIARDEDNALSVLHNAIDCEQYRFCQETRNRLRTDLHLDNRVVIGHVGRFEKQKNHKFLIDCFAYFHQWNPDSVMILIGSGSLLHEIKQYVQDKDLDKYVLFLGSRPDVWDYYQAMDQFWLPSLYEGLPVSVVEAQASGLPCLISDTVTTEAKILEETSFLKLEDGAENWSRKAMEVSEKEKRECGVTAVKNAGFDIRQESQRLQAFYLGE